jgi:hypothetical protein
VLDRRAAADESARAQLQALQPLQDKRDGTNASKSTRNPVLACSLAVRCLEASGTMPLWPQNRTEGLSCAMQRRLCSTLVTCSSKRAV